MSLNTMDELIGRTPPHNIESEQAVLGAVLRDNQALLKVEGLLKTGHFYRENHRLIFAAMCELFEQGEPIDLLTLQERLKFRERLEASGGASYLSKLIDMTPTAGHVKHHAEIVKKYAMVRRLIVIAGEITEAAHKNSHDPTELIDQAERSIFALGQEILHAEPIELGSVLEGLPLSKFQEERPTAGITTGFRDLDDHLGLICSDDLTIVAGKEGIGKSAFCHQVALHVLDKLARPVFLWTGEMNAEQVALRIACQQGKIDSRFVRAGTLSGDDEGHYDWTRRYFKDRRFLVDDTPTASIREIVAKARRIKAREGLGLIVIDNLTLVAQSDPGKIELSYRENIQRLRAACSELRVPILAVANYRQPDKLSGSRPPINEDIYGGSSLRYTATNLLHLYRITEKSKTFSMTPGNARELKIGKARYAPTKTMRLSWEPKWTRFGDFIESSV